MLERMGRILRVTGPDAWGLSLEQLSMYGGYRQRVVRGHLESWSWRIGGVANEARRATYAFSGGLGERLKR